MDFIEKEIAERKKRQHEGYDKLIGTGGYISPGHVFGDGALQPVREGVGMKNTRARLEQLYGERASLAWENVDVGARVTVTMPFVTQRETVEPAQAASAPPQADTDRADAMDDMNEGTPARAGIAG